MERRYLVAALALAVTFAGFSRGFRSLQQLSQQRSQPGQGITGLQCGSVPTMVSHWIAKVKSEFYPGNPEEAQLLAELNLPLAAMQAKVAEQAARRSEAAAQIARDSAMREAERAQRDAIRMHEQMVREKSRTAMPITIDLRALDRLDQRIQIRTADTAQRMIARNVRMQVAAAKMATVSLRIDSSGKYHSPCPSRAQIQ